MNFKLLEKLSVAFGPSGCEDEVADIIKNEVGHFADEIITDALGNFIVKINGNWPAHIFHFFLV